MCNIVNVIQNNVQNGFAKSQNGFTKSHGTYIAHLKNIQLQISNRISYNNRVDFDQIFY